MGIIKKALSNLYRDVIIAIIDTGVDLSQLNKSNLWFNTEETLDDSIDNDGNGYIDDGRIINYDNASLDQPFCVQNDNFV